MILTTKCDYCGTPKDIDMIKHFEKIASVGSVFNLICQNCGKALVPVFSCRLMPVDAWLRKTIVLEPQKPESVTLTLLKSRNKA